MNPGTIGAIIALAAVAVGLCVLAVDKWNSTKKKRLQKKLEGGVVGSEVLELEDGEIITAPSIPLFNNRDTVSVTINGIVDTLAGEVHCACEKALRKSKSLRVIINTTGGDVTTANTIVGLLRHFRDGGNEVWIVVEGKCFSAGMTILMAVEPQYRLAVQGSEFMIHAAKTASGERINRSQACDAEQAASIAVSSLITRASLDALYKSGKDCVFSAADADKMNIIGGII